MLSGAKPVMLPLAVASAVQGSNAPAQGRIVGSLAVSDLRLVAAPPMKYRPPLHDRAGWFRPCPILKQEANRVVEQSQPELIHTSETPRRPFGNLSSSGHLLKKRLDISSQSMLKVVRAEMGKYRFGGAERSCQEQDGNTTKGDIPWKT